MGDFAVNTIVLAMKAVALMYDLATFIPYYILHRPDKIKSKSGRIKAVPVTGKPSDPWRSVDVPSSGLTTTLFPECNTLADMYNRACKKYPSKPCLGTRELLSEEEEVQSNGKVFKKVVMGNYYWRSYQEVAVDVSNLATGLLATGQKSKSKLVIFAETRAEWMVAAQACFTCNFQVVTLYATLGVEAVIHGITETQVSHVITSIDLLPNFEKILPNTPTVTHVFVMGASTKASIDRLKLSIPDGITVMAMGQLLDLGQQNQANNLLQTVTTPKPDDIAVIMYTSGSTGLPKGVLISHRNLMCGTSGQVERIINIGENDIYIAYLPLAHVLELSAEISCFAMGTRIGYSSPTTLTDKSTKIKKGSQGDVSMLKPTLIAAVPVVMDRIYKTVWDKVNSSSLIKKALFQFAYDYKNKYIPLGYGTPLCDKIVFKTIKAILGGRVRLMLSGGAPLSGTTQRFMNICFCPVSQGYGLTETCGAGTVLEFSDLSTERVGPPLVCCEILLQNWDEGGYTTDDKPFPRGEIMLGGGNIAMGYYNNPEKTAEDFCTINGTRYFSTGDIGQFDSDGCLRIIDRKKDLVKLQHGEYVALSKVETVLKMSPLVEQICVVAHPHESNVVALVVPNESRLMTLAQKVGVEVGNMAEACASERMCSAVQKELASHGLKSKLQRMEIPTKLCLFPEPWMPDSGLITDSFKLKRKVMDQVFEEQIRAMYQAS